MRLREGWLFCSIEEGGRMRIRPPHDLFGGVHQHFLEIIPEVFPFVFAENA